MSLVQFGRRMSWSGDRHGVGDDDQPNTKVQHYLIPAASQAGNPDSYKLKRTFMSQTPAGMLQVYSEQEKLLHHKNYNHPGAGAGPSDDHHRNVVILHRTASATRNLVKTFSGIMDVPRSWSSSIRDMNSTMGFDSDMSSSTYASSFGSISAFGSRFGSSVDLHDGLIGLEDLAPVSEAGHIVQEPQGSQIIINNTHSAMILRGHQLENCGEKSNALLDDDDDDDPAGTTGGVDDNHDAVYDRIRHREMNAKQLKLVGLAPNGLASRPPNASTGVGLCMDSGINKKTKQLEEKRVAAAVKIQSVFRGTTVRRNNSVNNSMVAAAITIQRFYRGFRVRCVNSCSEIHQEREREVEVNLQAWAKSLNATRQYRKLYYTVVTVQQLWMSIKRRHRGMAATRIQTLYRGWSARKRYLHLYKMVLLLQRTRRSRIQQLQQQRRIQAQQQASDQKHLEEEVNSQQLRLREVRAAVKIQSVYREWVARKSFALKEMSRSVRVQAGSRRNRALKFCKQISNAPLVVRRMWRRYKVRQLEHKNVTLM